MADLEQNAEFDDGDEGDAENLDVTPGAEDATAGQDNNGNFINQEAVNTAIGKQHQKFQDEARKSAGLQTELDAANERLAAYEATSEPIIPEIPETFDPEFHEKMAVRDAAIKAKADWDSDAAGKVSKDAEKATNDANAANATIAEKATKFRENATKMGLDVPELQKAEQVVASYGISPQIASHILGQEQGPLIVKYLSENIMVLNELTQLSPIDAAVKISTSITAAASKLRTGSKAPDPLELEVGKGVTEGDSEYLKGVTFE